MPQVENGDIKLAHEIISLMIDLDHWKKDESSLLVKGYAFSFARYPTKAISHAREPYFRPDMNLRDLRTFVYPITGEPNDSWEDTTFHLSLDGLKGKVKKPKNANILCCKLVIAVLKRQLKTKQ